VPLSTALGCILSRLEESLFIVSVQVEVILIDYEDLRA
jgi:hypothetical protein